MNRVLLVGCGHMGSILLHAWYKKKSYNISVIDPNSYINIKKKYNNKITVYQSLNKIKKINKFNTIIFAVKPQIAKQVVSQFKNLFGKEILFISIIAGKKIVFFDKNLDHSHQIIRAMPNLPAQVKKGITCLVANNMTTKKNRNIAKDLFINVGKTIWLKKESDIDKVTAISGSGPAYFFLFIQYLISKAIQLGLKPNISKELVYQTALGSIDLLIKDNKNALELRKKIAITGGTTEAAINVFEKNLKFKKIIGQAIEAAYNRSKKLGNK